LFSVSFWLKLAHLLRNCGGGQAGGRFRARNIFSELVKTCHFLSPLLTEQWSMPPRLTDARIGIAAGDTSLYWRVRQKETGF
jgi:hypothetical protein